MEYIAFGEETHLTENTLSMNSYRHVFVMCMILCMCSCASDYSPDLDHSNLTGYWDMTSLSGLMFMEFTSQGKVLIEDRGAIGVKDVSKHYYQEYVIEDNAIKGLPGGCSMEDIEIRGDRMTFAFVNPEVDYTLLYSADKVEDLMADDATLLLNREWRTVEENNVPVAAADQKESYFSRRGIYLLKTMEGDAMEIFNWDWTREGQICYTKYQRPQFIPDKICLNFTELTEDQAVFYIEGNEFMLIPTEDI